MFLDTLCINCVRDINCVKGFVLISMRNFDALKNWDESGFKNVCLPNASKRPANSNVAVDSNI